LEKIQRESDKVKPPEPILPKPLRTLKKEALKRNINLKIMPTSFTRRKQNTTYFNRSKKCVHWRVEWLFVEEDVQMTDENVNEMDSLLEVLRHHFESINVSQKLRNYMKIGLENLTFLMKVPNTNANKPMYYHLEGHQKLVEALAYKEIIEFPTILVIHSNNSKKYPIANYSTQVEEEKGAIQEEEKSQDDTIQKSKVLAGSILDKFLQN